MSGELVLILCMVVFFSSGPSAGEVRGRQADGCTSGFMSLDRIEAVLEGGLGNAEIFPFPDVTAQLIIPDMNFTCAGSVLSWTFGAHWEGHSSQYTELQIWRSSGNGSYTKVGNTTIMFEEEGSTQLYQYTLPSPLPFQAGDILGYFQGSTSTSQLALLYESTTSAPQIYYTIQDTPMSEFSIGPSLSGYHVLISVETDSAGCDCGFMSVERMRILLGLEVVGDRITRGRRQQITPSINFTCDGLITKWIIGADWRNNNDELYPELQVWRNVGNDTYHKINGTFINILTESQTSIYEYDNFSPIPFLAGDILGIFHPRRPISQLTVWHERDNGPVNYYIPTDNESPYDIIDLQDMPSSYSQVYYPLVTVEIISTSSSSFNSPLIGASSRGEISTGVPQLTAASHTSSQVHHPMVTMKITSQFSTLHSSSTTSAILSLVSYSPPPHSGDGGGSSDAVSIDSLSAAVGVAGALLITIAATVITITMLVCLRRRCYKMTTTDNVVYMSSSGEVKLNSNAAYFTTSTSEVTLTPNAAYSTSSGHSPLSCENTYTYISARATTGNTTFNKPTDEAHNIPTVTNDITTSTNEAYGIITSTNEAHVGSDIPTSSNPAYQASTRQTASDDLIYDYV